MLHPEDIENMADRYVYYLDRGNTNGATQYITTIKDTLGTDIAQQVINKASEIIINQ